MQRASLVIQSAMRINGIIIPGLHHYDHFMIDIMHILDVGCQWDKKDNFENGYLDQYGKFYTTAEAILLVIKNGQILESETKNGTLSHLLWNSDQLRIVCPAVYHDSYTFLSPNYFDHIYDNWCNRLQEHDYWRTLPKERFVKGFIDSNGIFRDPHEALYIAMAAKQLHYPKEFPITQLLVEDLY